LKKENFELKSNLATLTKIQAEWKKKKKKWFGNLDS
jgi:hypothetical protein